jgi:peptide/nickel transport system substrate-binding protein
MKIAKLLAFFPVLAMVMLIPGCQKSSPATTAAARDLVVAVGVESTYHTTFTDSGQSGDLDQIVLYNVYDTLFYKDTTDGSIKPWLGASWEMSPDGKEIKIKLRDDVYFHDGSKMTAEDVKFTLDNARKSQIGNGLLINYNTTEIIDDYNIVIRMDYPYNAIMNALCSRTACIMSKAYYDKVGLAGYKQTPIGTGAYKWLNWTSGDSIVLERFDKYWGGLPSFNKVTIKTISDINTQILALESGDVDVIVNAPIENMQYLNNPNVEWDSCPSNATEFLIFNMQDTAWVSKDINFRKAVQHAIDKEAINNAVFAGKGIIVDIMGVPGFTARPTPGTYSTYERSMEKAREYLKASNYDGRVFNIVCTAGSAIQKSAEVIQGTLYELGINAKVTATDSATFFDTTRNTGDFDAQLVINTASVLDEDTLFLRWTIERFDFKNISMPRGQEINDLLVAARREANDNKRLEMYARASSIINEDAYAVFILGDVNTMAYRKGLKGISSNLAKYYRFSEWSY